MSFINESLGRCILRHLVGMIQRNWDELAIPRDALRDMLSRELPTVSHQDIDKALNYLRDEGFCLVAVTAGAQSPVEPQRNPVTNSGDDIIRIKPTLWGIKKYYETKKL